MLLIGIKCKKLRQARWKSRNGVEEESVEGIEDEKRRWNCECREEMLICVYVFISIGQAT